MKLPHETVMAYVDGELDAAARLSVEAAMAADPEARVQVERELKLRAQLQTSFDRVLEEPVPQRLIDTARNAPSAAAGAGASGVTDLAGARAAKAELSSAAKRRWALPEWGAIAASLVVGVFLGQAVLRGPETASLASNEGWLVARGALAEALATQLASTQRSDAPVLIGVSYKDQAGDYCRTFVVREGEALAGVACRANDDWRVQVLAQGATGGADAGGYRMAGVELPPAVMRAVESQISGEPLDAEAEATAQKRGWK